MQAPVQRAIGLLRRPSANAWRSWTRTTSIQTAVCLNVSRRHWRLPGAQSQVDGPSASPRATPPPPGAMPARSIRARFRISGRSSTATTRFLSATGATCSGANISTASGSPICGRSRTCRSLFPRWRRRAVSSPSTESYTPTACMRGTARGRWTGRGCSPVCAESAWSWISPRGKDMGVCST